VIIVDLNDVSGFKDIIEKERTRQGKTMRELCEDAGVSHSTYWWWLKHGHDVTLSSAIRYADVLGIKVCVR
jgi:transcriptional regulator with XRE-family HTH domain